MSNLSKFFKNDSLSDFRDEYVGFRNIFDKFDKLADTIFSEQGLSTINSSLDNPYFIPRIEVVEQENILEVRVEIPGLNEKDIDISLNQGCLTISGEKKIETNKIKDTTKYKKSEIFYGKFSRSIYLGQEYNLDTIKAISENGVLTVIVEKNKKEQPESKKITIEKK